MGKIERHKRKKERDKKEAFVKVKELFLKAQEIFPKSQALANRAIRRARRLAMKNKITLAREQKRKFCKHCYAFFVPGITYRVRLSGQKVVYLCLSCKRFTRFPYVREKKVKATKK